MENMGENKRLKSGRIYHVVSTICFLFIIIIMVYPMWYVIMGSFMDNAQFATDRFNLWPNPFTLQAYRYMTSTQDFLTPYKNTLIVVTVGTLISLITTSLAGFALSKKSLPGRRFIMLMIVITMVFSGGIIPTYILVSQLKLVNTLWALFIPGMINTFYMIIMRTHFASLPDSLEESAKIDGAGYFTIFFRIVLPLSKPILATISLFYIVDRWNDMSGPLYFISDSKNATLQLVIYRLLSKQSRELVSTVSAIEGTSIKEIQRFASVVMSSAPVLLVYPFLQKYFVKGVMIGGVKG